MSETTGNNWSGVQERGLYRLMRFTMFMHRILGPLSFKFILYPIVSYYFLFVRIGRESSLDYLRHLQEFAPQTGIKATWWNSYKHLINFAESIVDKISAWNGYYNRDDVEFHGMELVREMVSKNQGGILLASHLGNIEICRALNSVAGQAKINVLLHTKHSQTFNRLISEGRIKSNMTIIEVTELSPATAILLEEKTSKGEFVIIVGDRVPVTGNGRTTEAEFLGEKAHFAQGPFILAALLKCPVLTLFCLKIRGKYHIFMEHFTDRVKLPRGKREEGLQDIIQKYARRLEQYCLKAPLQWYNFYFYWHQPGQDNDQD